MRNSKKNNGIDSPPEQRSSFTYYVKVTNSYGSFMDKDNLKVTLSEKQKTISGLSQAILKEMNQTLENYDLSLKVTLEDMWIVCRGVILRDDNHEESVKAENTFSSLHSGLSNKEDIIGVHVSLRESFHEKYNDLRLQQNIGKLDKIKNKYSENIEQLSVSRLKNKEVLILIDPFITQLGGNPLTRNHSGRSPDHTKMDKKKFDTWYKNFESMLEEYSNKTIIFVVPELYNNCQHSDEFSNDSEIYTEKSIEDFIETLNKKTLCSQKIFLDCGDNQSLCEYIRGTQNHLDIRNYGQCYDKPSQNQLPESFKQAILDNTDNKIRLSTYVALAYQDFRSKDIGFSPLRNHDSDDGKDMIVIETPTPEIILNLQKVIDCVSNINKLVFAKKNTHKLISLYVVLLESVKAMGDEMAGPIQKGIRNNFLKNAMVDQYFKDLLKKNVNNISKFECFRAGNKLLRSPWEAGSVCCICVIACLPILYGGINLSLDKFSVFSSYKMAFDIASISVGVCGLILLAWMLRGNYKSDRDMMEALIQGFDKSNGGEILKSHTR
jgi:hypothetical protein